MQTFSLTNADKTMVITIPMPKVTLSFELCGFEKKIVNGPIGIHRSWRLIAMTLRLARYFRCLFRVTLSVERSYSVDHNRCFHR